MTELKLLPREKLIKTGDVDHADWNFKGILGRIQRTRFELIVSVLGSLRPQRLLEVGYGSGIFMPELARRCRELYGVDVHGRHAEVAEALRTEGVTAQLFRGSAEALDFPDRYFDCIVAVSSLEFIGDIGKAARELRRVLSDSGCLVMVTPGHSAVVDLGLKILTGASARKDYGSRREALLPTLTQFFSYDRRRTFPPLTGPFCLYQALKLSGK